MDSNDLEQLIASYRKANKRLILLDYDGTLVDYELIPENARLPEHLTDILTRLIKKPLTKVYIISGRAHQDIDKLLDHISIDIISEHGSMIKTGNRWENMISESQSWKASVIPLLMKAVSDCPKSFVEEKKFSLAWHYRNADTISGYDQSRKLIGALENFLPAFNLRILDGKKVIEILPDKIGKGKAVKKLIDQNNYDFILSIGDDATDEEMFEYLSDIPNSFTIKVGNGDSMARLKLEGINEVVSFLKQLSE